MTMTSDYSRHQSVIIEEVEHTFSYKIHDDGLDTGPQAGEVLPDLLQILIIQNHLLIQQLYHLQSHRPAAYLTADCLSNLSIDLLCVPDLLQGQVQSSLQQPDLILAEQFCSK